MSFGANICTLQHLALIPLCQLLKSFGQTDGHTQGPGPNRMDAIRTARSIKGAFEEANGHPGKYVTQIENCTRPQLSVERYNQGPSRGTKHNNENYSNTLEIFAAPAIIQSQDGSCNNGLDVT